MFNYQKGGQITCNTVGSMTLLDNEHFKITAIAAPLEQTAGNAEVSDEAALALLGLSVYVWNVMLRPLFRGSKKRPLNNDGITFNTPMPYFSIDQGDSGVVGSGTDLV